MKKITTKETKDNITSINVYFLPEVGDIVYDKNGNEGTCTEVINLWHGNLFEIFDGEKYATINENPFKEKILLVKSNKL